MRHTHNKDMAVHYPLHKRFMHHSGEVYEEEGEPLKICEGNEDPDCSFKWAVTSVSDHLVYLVKQLGIAGCV